MSQVVVVRMRCVKETPVNFPPSAVSNRGDALDDERAKRIICRATIKIKQAAKKRSRESSCEAERQESLSPRRAIQHNWAGGRTINGGGRRRKLALFMTTAMAMMMLQLEAAALESDIPSCPGTNPRPIVSKESCVFRAALTFRTHTLALGL